MIIDEPSYDNMTNTFLDKNYINFVVTFLFFFFLNKKFKNIILSKILNRDLC